MLVIYQYTRRHIAEGLELNQPRSIILIPRKFLLVGSELLTTMTFKILSSEMWRSLVWNKFAKYYYYYFFTTSSMITYLFRHKTTCINMRCYPTRSQIVPRRLFSDIAYIICRNLFSSSSRKISHSWLQRPPVITVKLKAKWRLVNFAMFFATWCQLRYSVWQVNPLSCCC
jgi:hypothetical protein